MEDGFLAMDVHEQGHSQQGQDDMRVVLLSLWVWVAYVVVGGCGCWGGEA